MYNVQYHNDIEVTNYEMLEIGSHPNFLGCNWRFFWRDLCTLEMEKSAIRSATAS